MRTDSDRLRFLWLVMVNDTAEDCFANSADNYMEIHGEDIPDHAGYLEVINKAMDAYEAVPK